MPSPAGSSTNKQRKAIGLDMKMKIIKDYEGGEKVKVIADNMKLAHSTISTILKDKVIVKAAVKASTALKQSSQASGKGSFTRWKRCWPSGLMTRFTKKSR